MRKPVGMLKELVWFILAYGLSQFYRACLAVFAPVLQQDIGLRPDQVSTALGIWFLCFAAMQIPVGWLLDHRSPRLMAVTLLSLGGGLGAGLFAFAQGPLGVYVAMGLIGIGCSPVLMTGFYVIARTASPAHFGTYAGLILGLGSLGNVAAAAPLSFSMSLIGWRATLIALAVLTLCVAFALYRSVQDPPRVDREVHPSARMRDLLRLRPLYPVLLIAMVAYAPAAGLRGSWIGSYLTETFGATPAQIGAGTLWMAFAMIAGALAFGPMDRLIRSPKIIVAGSAALALLGVLALWLTSGRALGLAILCFIVIGFFASNFPQVMAHGRKLIPQELMGRGVTLINLFSIGGVGLSQMITARLFVLGSEGAGYDFVFGYYAVSLMIGVVVYLLFARDPG